LTAISGPANSYNYSSRTKKIAAKLTKDQATAVCSHEAENINQTYLNFDTNNGNNTAYYTYETNCIVQE
jgi:hypothetical protein